MGQSMFLIDAPQDNKKVKYAWGGKNKKEGTWGVTKARSRLIEPEAPLIVTGLPEWSLSFANRIACIGLLLRSGIYRNPSYNPQRHSLALTNNTFVQQVFVFFHCQSDMLIDCCSTC